MLVSIIIPTYKREKDLQECLNSILSQSDLPFEVIIIDNANSPKTEELVKKNKELFEKNNVFLKYLINRKENSLTSARNIGVKNAVGDIILFLDDDVVLDKGYIKNILKVYEKYPNAIGVQGYITITSNSLLKKFINLISKIFFLFHFEKEKCKVLPSLSGSYPSSLNRIAKCEWLSGANHSYKKHIFTEFSYDENLKKYSEGEDLELSYRIFKKYPGSLYITPYAKLVHKTSPQGRLSNKELITMREVYGLYLFYKIIDQNLKNKIIYLWSRVGKLIFYICRLFLKPSLISFIDIFYLIKAYLYCIIHIRKIKKGDLNFFNENLDYRK
jgi:GT2 family glycosyltransferase